MLKTLPLNENSKPGAVAIVQHVHNDSNKAIATAVMQMSPDKPPIMYVKYYTRKVCFKISTLIVN